MNTTMAGSFKALFADYHCDIAIGHAVAGKIRELVENAGFNTKGLLIVCDTATHRACGETIIKALGSRFLILKGKPHADMQTVEHIRSHKAETLLAVGSGTISDLCKYASFLDKTPYAVFATAPSMNGYFSANASITVHGHKQSLPAHLPEAIFCDLGVIAHAPQRLIKSGLGDSLCRPTAQADWLLSHLLFKTPYNPLPFTLLAEYESELFAHAEKLVMQDTGAVELLLKTLLVSGLGMVIAGGSYPASEGEHLIAHTMEMKHGDALPETYHGEQIGVTTLLMAKLQQEILSKKLHLQKTPDPRKTIESYFSRPLSESVWKSYESKYALQEKYDAVNERLQKEDSTIRDALRAVTLPEKTLYSVLQNAGAPVSAKDLGWKEDELQQAVKYAKFIRDRFTFLDLAY